MKFAVVILNWNGKSLLEKFLPSVVEHSSDATIYVADNNSTDDSISFVQSHYPQINIIKNTSNGGYAKGYNDALQTLNEDVFVLLNSDVEVTSKWLQPFINAFTSDASLVAAQPKILDYKNKSNFEYAGACGGFLDAYGYPFCRGRIFNTLETDHNQFNDSTIFWATGACLFVKRDAFNDVQGFDEDLFAHQEEIDLCWRLQAHGGVVKCLTSSSVYHVGGATLAQENPRKTYYNFRNSLLVLVKNVSKNVLPVLFIRLILDGIAALRFLLQLKPAHFFAVIRGHFGFYALLPLYIKKRKSTKKLSLYAKTNSIVWQYFIKKRRFFKELD